MKKLNIKFPFILRGTILCLLTLFCNSWNGVIAQDSAAAEVVQPRPVTIFDAQYLIDNQTVTVLRKNSLLFAIQHRFGTVTNGKDDVFGIFGAANIRLGINYSFINNLSVGFGLTKNNLIWDFNAKYALVKQMDIGGWPVSITYFGNIGLDSRKNTGLFVENGDRLSYYNQLIIARKITEKISIQVAPSLSHFNNVEAYRKSDGTINPKMNNDHLAVSFSGVYKISEKFHLIANYDQPLTQHLTNNPHPNICFGIESISSGHSFQIFAGNSNAIVPQYVNFYNQNDFQKGEFLIGFNITRRWNFN